MTAQQASIYAREKLAGHLSKEQEKDLDRWIGNCSREEYIQFTDAIIADFGNWEIDERRFKRSNNQIIENIGRYVKANP